MAPFGVKSVRLARVITGIILCQFFRCCRCEHVASQQLIRPCRIIRYGNPGLRLGIIGISCLFIGAGSICMEPDHIFPGLLIIEHLRAFHDTAFCPQIHVNVLLLFCRQVTVQVLEIIVRLKLFLILHGPQDNAFICPVVQILRRIEMDSRHRPVTVGPVFTKPVPGIINLLDLASVGLDLFAVRSIHLCAVGSGKRSIIHSLRRKSFKCSLDGSYGLICS